MDRQLIDVKSIVEASRRRLDDYLLSVLPREPQRLYLASSHLLKSGGKRLRPFMVLKSCELFCGDGEKAIPVAAALEFVHNFSLVHDDIMDNDSMRHSRPTVHIEYGVPMAILAGDMLFANAFRFVSSVEGMKPERVVKLNRLLSEASVQLCRGQAEDMLMAEAQGFVSQSAYFRMIERKTAALFEAACRMGSIVGGAGVDEEAAMATFGRDIGIAFQLVDDALGVVGDGEVTGKPVGGDLREGKKTLVTLLAFQNSSAVDREKIMKVFGAKASSEDDVKRAIEAIARTGAEERVRSLAKKHADDALAHLQSIPNRPSRDALVALADFIVTRKR